MKRKIITVYINANRHDVQVQRKSAKRLARLINADVQEVIAL